MYIINIIIKNNACILMGSQVMGVDNIIFSYLLANNVLCPVSFYVSEIKSWIKYTHEIFLF